MGFSALNIGSGYYPVVGSGWKNIDVDSKCNPDECYDIRQGIREKDKSIDQIIISHVLMYFTEEEVKGVLKECFRVLKDDGFGLIMVTEDNKHLKIRNNEQQEQYGKGVLFSRTKMVNLMEQAGFLGIFESTPFDGTEHHLKYRENYPLAQGLASVYYLAGYKKNPGEKIVYLALDDFGEFNSNFDLLWRLRFYFDNFKVNLFGPVRWNERKEWLSYLKSLPWIQLCVHGYDHNEGEELDSISLDILAKDPSFAKVYKAPYWKLSDKMYNDLKERDFKILLHKDDPREGIKFNWEIDQEIPEDNPLHSYGHIYKHDYKSKNGNTGSALFHYFQNIMKLPKDTDFRFY